MSIGRCLKISLCANGLTQKWLLERLSEQGISIDKTYLSHVLNHKRTGPRVDEILSKSAEILADYEQSQSK